MIGRVRLPGPAAVCLASAVLSLTACAKPEARKAAGVQAASSNGPVLTGVPAAGLLTGAVETDVPGELSMRVPADWIGQQKLTSGHAMFAARDGRTVVTVTEAALDSFTDAGVLGWAAKPWTKTTAPSVTGFRAIQLGRSNLPAEQGTGTAMLEGKPARAAYARLRRSTGKGAVAVLVTMVVRDDAPSDDHARAEAVVRSLGTR